MAQFMVGILVLCWMLLSCKTTPTHLELTEAHTGPTTTRLDQDDPAAWPEVVQIDIGEPVQSRWVDDVLAGSGRNVNARDIQRPYRHCTGVFISPRIVLTLRECFAYNDLNTEIIAQNISIRGVVSKIQHVHVHKDFVLVGLDASANHPWLTIDRDPFLQLGSDPLLGVGYGITEMRRANSLYYDLDTTKVAFQSFEINQRIAATGQETTRDYGRVPLNANRGSVIVHKESRRLISIFRSLISAGRGHPGYLSFVDLTSPDLTTAMRLFQEKSGIDLGQPMMEQPTYDAIAGELKMKIIFRSRTGGVEMILSNRQGHLHTEKLKRNTASLFSETRPPFIRLKFSEASRMPRRGDKVILEVLDTQSNLAPLNGRQFVLE